MPEGIRSPEDETVIELVDGQDVAKYLTSGLKDKFLRVLVTANNNGVFDEQYFKRYRYGFEQRVRRGRLTLLLADGEPAALGAINIMEKYPDGRTLYEMGNLVVLPEFEGRGFASRLMDCRFQKIRTNWPNDPIVVMTLQEKIAQKCIKLGMKEHSGTLEMKIRNPKEKFPEFSQEEYEAKINEWTLNMKKSGYRNFIFDPLEKFELEKPES